MAKSLSAQKRGEVILSIVFSLISLIWVLPVILVLINSFKLNTYVKTDTFALPLNEMSAGFSNFIKGMTYGNYPFLKSAGYSLMVTLFSTALILVCTSMAAWYITRVDSRFCKLVYLLCVFSKQISCFPMGIYSFLKDGLNIGALL